MVRQIALAALLVTAVPAVADVQSVGIFGQWGAFVRGAPKNCYAIAEPAHGLQPAGWQAFASVGYWPQRHIRGEVHFRLSRQKRPGSAVLLRIDDQTFQLIAGGADAWAPDAQGDAAVVQAMRSGVDMTIETRTVSGGLVRDSYLLRGAATAIDAAAVACAR